MEDVLRGLEEKLQNEIGDRRFKLRICSYSSNGLGTSCSAIVKFQGRRYYVNVIQPCDMYKIGKGDMYTIGKVEVEDM